MIFLSINVKGVGAEGKVGWVKGLKSKNNITFLAIQETQMANSDAVNIDRIWGGQGYNYDMVGADGRSGG